MDGLSLGLNCNEGAPLLATGGQLTSSLEITPDLFRETGSQAGGNGCSTEVQQCQNIGDVQWSILN